MAEPSRAKRVSRFLAVLLGSCGFDANGQSQTGAEVEVEEIVVTGSRLATLSASEAIPPVDHFAAIDLEQSGVNSLADFARYLTYNNALPNAETSLAGTAPGASYFNLRGIGPQGTLTLLNGRRIAAYGAALGDGQTFVDIDAIPLHAIESIEVLKDGASAIYGSEAIAGVVNVQLKKNLEGLTISGGYLTTSRSDSQETNLDLSWGRQRRDMRIVLSASALEREALAASERGLLDDMDLRDVHGYNLRTTFSSPTTIFRPELQPARAQAEPDCPDDSDNSDVSREIVVPPHPVVESFCKMNVKPFMDARPRLRRYGVSALVERDLRSGVSFFMDLYWSRKQSDARLAPSITDRTPLNASMPVALANHPANPVGELVAISYSVVDGQPRRLNAEADTSRAMVGFGGRMYDWQWEVSALASESKVRTTQFNLIDAALFQNALLGMGGPNQDQYYNPFGVSPENEIAVLDGFTVPRSTRDERMREQALELEASHALFALPGGESRLALGMQYRTQRGSAIGDAFQVSGSALGMESLSPYGRERRIFAAYLELAMPLWQTFDVQVAGRVEDYSDFGATADPKIALRWQLSDSVSLRSSWGSSFRAPTFTELYRSPREGLSFLRDPERCAYTQAAFDCNVFPYTSYRGGNPGLEPETGTSLLAGLVWEPRLIPGLSVTLDGWQFEHEQRIVAVSPQFVLDHFGLDEQLVDRAPPLPTDPPGAPGPIRSVTAVTMNIDKLRTQGYDLALDYQQTLAGGRNLTARFNATYLASYRFGESSTGQLVDFELAGNSEYFAMPRVRANLALRWLQGADQLAAILHYVGDYESRVNVVADGLETRETFVVGTHTTLDLQYLREFASLHGARLQLGCQNCLDRRPPTYNYTYSGEELHDVRGAVLYARWTQGFH